MNQVVQLWTGHSYTQKVEAKDQSSRVDKFGLFFNNTTITTTCPQIDRSDWTNPVRHANLLAFLFWTKVSSPPGTRILLLLVPILMLIHVEQGGASMATRTPKDDCMANTTANLTAQVEAGSDIPGCVRNKSDLSVGKNNTKHANRMETQGRKATVPAKVHWIAMGMSTMTTIWFPFWDKTSWYFKGCHNHANFGCKGRNPSKSRKVFDHLPFFPPSQRSRHQAST